MEIVHPMFPFFLLITEIVRFIKFETAGKKIEAEKINLKSINIKKLENKQYCS